MNERMKKFIEKQTSATICCIDEQGKPYCFSIFYAIDSARTLLYFKSAAETKHSPLLKMNSTIAGTILPDKLNLLSVKGIQFEGSAYVEDEGRAKAIAASVYYSKHPMARAVDGEIWTIRVDHIKFTDNSLGFGKKILWERNECAAETATFKSNYLLLTTSIDI